MENAKRNNRLGRKVGWFLVFVACETKDKEGETDNWRKSSLPWQIRSRAGRTDVTGGLSEGGAEIFFPLRLGREGRINMKTLFWS